MKRLFAPLFGYLSGSSEGTLAVSDFVLVEDDTIVRVDPSRVLPSDLLVKVLSLLSTREDLLHASHVCRRFRALIQSRNLWQRFAQQFCVPRDHARLLLMPKVLTVNDPFSAMPLQWSFKSWTLTQDELQVQLDMLQRPGLKKRPWDDLLDRVNLGSSTDSLHSSLESSSLFNSLGASVGSTTKASADELELVIALGPGVWPRILVSPHVLLHKNLCFSRVMFIGAGNKKGDVVVSNAGSIYNPVNVYASESWDSLSTETRCAYQFHPTVSCEIRNLTIQSDPAVKEVFGVRCSGPGAELVMRDCHVNGAPFSNVLADRGSRIRLVSCQITNAKQNGVFFFEADGSVEKCHITNSDSAGVSVSLTNYGSAQVLVEDCVIQQAKETSGAVVRSRGKACNTRIAFLRNTFKSCYSGVCVYPRLPPNVKGEPVDMEEAHTDEGTATCEHENHSGTHIQLIGNQIINPRHHGIIVGYPCGKVNAHRLVISQNHISHCRGLGLFLTRPDSKWSDGVDIAQDNELEGCPDNVAIAFRMRDCIEKGVCTRNFTGKHYELQNFYRCLTCSLTAKENLGVCSSCAQVCHAGHQLYLYGRVTAFCDCGDKVVQGKKQECPVFDGDPPLKEEIPKFE